MRWAEQNTVTGQERRKFLSEARAAPPLMFGTNDQFEYRDI